MSTLAFSLPDKKMLDVARPDIILGDCSTLSSFAAELKSKSALLINEETLFVYANKVVIIIYLCIYSFSLIT
jgi:hypothetical protein